MRDVTVSVIVPTLNEENYIGLLLDDLSKQSYPACEVIVVDGGSRDKTQDEVKKYGFAQLVLDEPSVSKQRNTGARCAGGEILVFLDADTRLRSYFLERLVQDFLKRDLKMAVPLYVPASSSVMTHAVFWYINIVFFLLQKVLPSGAGPCMMVRRDIFLQEEGFKIAHSFQDMEWIRRLGKRYPFGVILERVSVSDRRFRSQGNGRMILLYGVLSVLFTLGLFGVANKIEYGMAERKLKKR